MLADKGAGPAVYEDVLRPKQLKGRSTDSLVERANLLQPTSRKTTETILVASPPCFAWDVRDFSGALAAAAKNRRATVIFLDTGLEVPPDAGVAVVHQAIEAFDKARRRAQTEPGRIKGWIKAVENRKADTNRRLNLIRIDWKLRQHTTQELLQRAGKDGKPMARNTAIHHLGDRKKEQKKWEDHQMYLARKEAKHEQQA